MTKLEEIEARHAADIHYSMTDDGMSEGIGDKACSQAVSDRAYLLAEVKRLNAPVTDEEAERFVETMGRPLGGLLTAGLALTAFLKGRMS